MNTPIEVTFRHMASSPALEEHIRQQAAALECCHRPIQHCHVTVDGPNLHCQDGREYRVHIFLRLPERDMRVSRSPSWVAAGEGATISLREALPPLEDVYVTVRDAFALLRHELERAHRCGGSTPTAPSTPNDTI
jgi:hypothetical protein